MWPFDKTKKQDDTVRAKWSAYPWAGIEIYFERMKKGRALQAWAKTFSADPDTPLMVSIAKADESAEDRSTGRILWWVNFAHIIYPVDSRNTTDRILRNYLTNSLNSALFELGPSTIMQHEFADFDSARSWCMLHQTWRIRFDLGPPYGFTPPVH